MDLVQSADQKISERCRITVSEILCEFPQVSRTALYEIITVRLGYHKFCTRWFPNLLIAAQKMQRMALALALTLLERYHKDGNEFVNHTI
jgi:hypothetical protein